MKLALALAFLLTCSSLAHAQQPVVQWADWASYGTAAANPGLSAYADAHDRKWCQLGQLAIAEGLGNGATLLLKHVVVSPRPCLGCPPDGFPSGHTMNSFIGFRSFDWRVGLTFGLITGDLRHEANRHTWTQVAVGALIGIGADVASTSLLTCQEK